jgi:hypothetical protein
MHDPRVGRFFSEDPLTPRYPHYSPYIFSGNNPILFLDLEGLEEKLPWYLGPSKYGGKPVLTLGLHNLEAIYYNRKEYLVGAPPTYQGQANASIFLLNSAGSAWNNLASTWNNALAGQNAGQMYEEGTSNLGKLVRRIENDGFKKTFSDPEVAESVTGGLMTMVVARKVGKLNVFTNTGKTFKVTSIRFSQTSVNGLDDLTKSMKKNGWKGDAIDIVKMEDNMYTTVDNTRLLAAKKVGIDVKANVHNFDDAISPEMGKRFLNKKGELPKTWGEAVQNRINSQSKSFRES